MKEELLYYLYSFYLKGENVRTTGGEELLVLDPGRRNHDGGPDFFNARVRIGNTLWAGNVEIHVKSSDWFQHRHNEDDAFDNIILHVVFECNAMVFRKSGELIPCVEMKDIMRMFDENRLKELMSSRKWIPCESLIGRVDVVFIFSWLNCLMVERLERRTGTIVRLFNNPGVTWEEVILKILFIGFGQRNNSDQFLMLANAIALEVIEKERKYQVNLEALLFGMAGLLPAVPVDDYAMELAGIFKSQKNKYNLTPLPGHIWKFRGNRPGGFPTIRISQLSNLLVEIPSFMLLSTPLPEIHELMNIYKCSASEYWKYHYVFSRKTKQHGIESGQGFILSLLVNVAIPLFFSYGKLNGEERYTSYALRILDDLPPEYNAQIKRWANLGIEIPSAFYTQALMELKEYYCDRIRCLNCRIGFGLLKKK